jgi:hypothetical protein
MCNLPRELMHMDSVKTKTKIYMIVISLITSLLLGIGMLRSTQSGPTSGHKAMTATQEIEGLEKSAPKSPEMARFLKHEKAVRDADQEATGDLSK